MSQFQRPIPVRGVDDVSGHAVSPDDDVEQGLTDEESEVHGHMHHNSDAEASEDDDVEGHIYVYEDRPQGGRSSF